MKKILLIGIILLMVSCEKNHAPVIHSITCSPESGKPGTVFTLAVVVSDEEGDVLKYNWSAESGEFTDSTNQVQVKWKSPIDGSGKTFDIAVSVTDEKAAANSSHQIKLASNSEPVVTDIRSYPTTDAAGAEFAVKVIATDADNDQLTYKWSCTDGEFTDGMDRSLARWLSPLSPQDQAYILAVEISDGINKIDTTLQINVLKAPGGSLTGKTNFFGCTIPISGVLVSIGEKSSRSDSTGHFEIKDISFGQQIAVASKADFTPVNQEVIISSGQTTETEFHLASLIFTSKIHGVIQDQEGKVLAGATVLILNPDQTESDLKTISDAQGNYELNSVPQSILTVLVRKDPDQLYRYESANTEISVTSQDTPLEISIQKFSLIPVVSTLPAPLVSYNYAKGGGEVTYDGESAIIKRGVCWSGSTNPQISDSKTANGTGTGSFESSLTGLTDGATYYVRAYATNSGGKTGYGEVISITTIPNGSFTDARDQQTYKTVDIGGQTWMAENLNFVAASGSWCYEDKTSYCSQYGRLYDWNRVTNVGSGKDICPAGWRVPTDAEWITLKDYLGENPGYKLKSISGWNKSSNGDNSLGFNAKPGGYRYSDGTYDGLNEGVSLWSVTTGQDGGIIQYNMNTANSQLLGFATRASGATGYVRCLKY